MDGGRGVAGGPASRDGRRSLGHRRALIVWLFATSRWPRSVGRRRGRRHDRAGAVISAAVAVLKSDRAALRETTERGGRSERRSPPTVTALVAVARRSRPAWQYAAPLRPRNAMVPASTPRSGDIGWGSRPATGSFDWWWVVGIQTHPPRPWISARACSTTALVWLVVGVVLHRRARYSPSPRGGGPRSSGGVRPRADAPARAGRHVGGVALLWHVAINIAQAIRAAGCGADVRRLFAAFRNWIGVASATGTKSGMLDRMKPYLPQVLAYVTVVLCAGSAAQLIRLGGDDWSLVWAVFVTLSGFRRACLFIRRGVRPPRVLPRPHRRAYSGASNPRRQSGRPATTAGRNRARDDDRQLSELVGGRCTWSAAPPTT